MTLSLAAAPGECSRESDAVRRLVEELFLPVAREFQSTD
jgi:hypothetical protein